MAGSQAIQQLNQQIQQNPALREALQRATTAEEVVQAAADVGIELSVEDLRALRASSTNDELSDAELEHAAGGFLPYFERLSHSENLSPRLGMTVTPEHWRL